MGSLKTQGTDETLSDVCSRKTLNSSSSLSGSKHCPRVLDLPAPDDDVDVVGKLVGDLGIVLKPLDVLKEGDKLSLDDWIEREQTSFSL